MKSKTQKISTITITRVALSTAVICVLGPLSFTLPISPVPISLGILGIFFAVYVNGMLWGTVSTLMYILLGFVGVPVFAGFTSGAGKLLGPTGGYIVGFVFSGLLFLLLTKVFGEKKVVIIVAMVLGLLLCYLIGTLWFVHVYAGTENAKSIGTVLKICVIPFIIPDACKMALAYIMGGLVKKAVR